MVMLSYPESDPEVTSMMYGMFAFTYPLLLIILPRYRIYSILLVR